MAKLIAGVGALLLSGYLGVASVEGGILQEPLSDAEPGDVGALVEADLQEDATVLATSGSAARGTTVTQEMSDDEKNRRREACVSDWESDMDWCKRSTKGEQRGECETRAKRRLVECLKRIP